MTFQDTIKKKQAGASLVAQWLRICLPVQGTRVQALVWEDPTCRGAAGPVLLSLRIWSLCSTTREVVMVGGPRTMMRSGPRLPQLEKALAQRRRPNTAINQSINQSTTTTKKNYNEVSPHNTQNGHHQKIYKQKCWRGCGEKEPSCTVGGNVN